MFCKDLLNTDRLINQALHGQEVFVLQRMFFASFSEKWPKIMVLGANQYHWWNVQ